MSHTCFTHFIKCHTYDSRISLHVTHTHTHTHFITSHICTLHTSLCVKHTLHYMSLIHFTHFIRCHKNTSHTSLPVNLHNFIITKLISTPVSNWTTSIFLLFSSSSLVVSVKIQTFILAGKLHVQYTFRTVLFWNWRNSCGNNYTSCSLHTWHYVTTHPFRTLTPTSSKALTMVLGFELELVFLLATILFQEHIRLWDTQKVLTFKKLQNFLFHFKQEIFPTSSVILQTKNYIPFPSAPLASASAL